jgi:hypothetical protein
MQDRGYGLPRTPLPRRWVNSPLPLHRQLIPACYTASLKRVFGLGETLAQTFVGLPARIAATKMTASTLTLFISTVFWAVLKDASQGVVGIILVTPISRVSGGWVRSERLLVLLAHGPRWRQRPVDKVAAFVGPGARARVEENGVPVAVHGEQSSAG